MSVIVIGGGWAGLAAAVKLAAEDTPVTLLESAKQLGGRARTAPFGEHRVDNGQHIMVGAYHHTLALFELLGIEEGQAYQRLPCKLQLHSPKGHQLVLDPPHLPAPFHLLAAILRAEGLSLREKALALKFCSFLAFSRFQLKRDISLKALLIRHRQHGRLSKLLWEPLCIATLNTPLKDASAQAFMRVLHDSFNRQKTDSDLIIPAQPLGQLFPEPAMHFIEERGGRLRLKTKVTEITTTNGQVRGVKTPSEELDAEQVILATHPVAASRLLDKLPDCREISAALKQLHYEPITTVYLQYPPEVSLPQTMMGLVDTDSQWVIDRRITGQPGLLAVVISTSGKVLRMDKPHLVDTVHEELKALLPALPAPLDARVISEKRATFMCDVDSQSLRPDNATSLPGLWLAGDYTDTGYPATLEGAVMSGLQAAEAVLAARD